MRYSYFQTCEERGGTTTNLLAETGMLFELIVTTHGVQEEKKKFTILDVLRP